MSNFLAIATVTATLQTMLQAAIGDDVPGASATVVRPDGSDNGLPERGVNIYLYQVTPNTAWRNEDLTTRTSDGRLVRKPRVALDLHYLLTFYGTENLLEPQRVLGSVARSLHDQPVLSRDNIESTISSIGYLTNSNLAEEIELIKLMPLSLSLEELSKLWSVFFQTPYTLSMAYLATTVLIEGDRSPQRSLPVRTRNITVFPFQNPVIDKVVSSTGDNDPVVFGGSLLIRGERLAGEIQTVQVGEVEITPDSIGNKEIAVPLTSVDLRAGVQGVQIIYANSSVSNVAPVVLLPEISKDLGDNYEIDVTGVVVDPEDATHSATVTVQLTPTVGQRQQVILYLNPLPPTVESAPAYSFFADERLADTDTVDFSIAGVEPGDYLVRIQVAGAETLLETDGTGTYNAPQTTI